MIEIAIGGIAVGAFLVGKWRYDTDDSEPEGCNGHHWGEPTRSTECSKREHEKAGLWAANDHRSTYIFGSSIVLKETGIKQCQDCGEYDTESVTLGKVPISEVMDE